ncbi:hypothetical protein BRD19_10225, partial [Halobacteriales archaeon SW_7_65_23]
VVTPDVVTPGVVTPGVVTPGVVTPGVSTVVPRVAVVTPCALMSVPRRWSPSASGRPRRWSPASRRPPRAHPRRRPRSAP